MHDPGRLGATALARALACGGHRLQEVLLDCLTTANPPEPLSPGDQLVLRLAFPERKRATAEARASSLFLSRATFYRRRRSALLALRDALDRLAATLPPRTG